MAQEIVRWITVNGVHIPIKNGQTQDEAVKEHFARHAKTEADQRERQMSQSRKEAESRNVPETPKFKDNKDYDQFIKDNFDTIKHWLNTDRSKDLEDVEEAWYNLRKEAEMKNIHEIESYDELGNDSPFRPSAYTGWFRNADSDYKPELAKSLFGTEGEFNKGLNIGYFNYRINVDDYSFLYQKWRSDNAMSFKEWLNTPMTLYRGHRGQQSVKSDVFIAYTPDKKVAQKFGKNLDTITIKPIDTWGSYNLTGEQEYWIPTDWLKKNKK